MPAPSRSRLLPGRRVRGLRAGRDALAAALVIGAALAGCSSAASQGARPTPSSASSRPSASSGVTTLAITVTGTTVKPAPARVELAAGKTLRLVVTVDHDDELHAHGFEVEKEIAAGQPVTVDLTGAAPGLYEVELHHPELRLLQVLVR